MQQRHPRTARPERLGRYFGDDGVREPTRGGRVPVSQLAIHYQGRLVGVRRADRRPLVASLLRVELRHLRGGLPGGLRIAHPHRLRRRWLQSVRADLPVEDRRASRRCGPSLHPRRGLLRKHGHRPIHARLRCRGPHGRLGAQRPRPMQHASIARDGHGDLGRHRLHDGAQVGRDRGLLGLQHLRPVQCADLARRGCRDSRG